jgi:hypothetical protein
MTQQTDLHLNDSVYQLISLFPYTKAGKDFTV